MKVKAKSYRDLEVWQKAHSLVLDIYTLTKSFPKEELYGIVSQIRRAAVSIPANISEGFARKGIKDKLRFYTIAAGSLNEVDYYLLLAKDLNFNNDLELNHKVEEVGRMLKAYMNAIEASNY